MLVRDSSGATEHAKATSASLLPRACLKSEFFPAVRMFQNPSLMRFLNASHAATKIHNHETSTWFYITLKQNGMLSIGELMRDMT